MFGVRTMQYEPGVRREIKNAYAPPSPPALFCYTTE